MNRETVAQQLDELRQAYAQITTREIPTVNGPRRETVVELSIDDIYSGDSKQHPHVLTPWDAARIGELLSDLAKEARETE